MANTKLITYLGSQGRIWLRNRQEKHNQISFDLFFNSDSIGELTVNDRGVWWDSIHGTFLVHDQKVVSNQTIRKYLLPFLENHTPSNNDVVIKDSPQKKPEKKIGKYIRNTLSVLSSIVTIAFAII